MRHTAGPQVTAECLQVDSVAAIVMQYMIVHKIKISLLVRNSGTAEILSPPESLLKRPKLDGTLLGGPETMKLWLIASAFHDIGYPFEEMKTSLNTFALSVQRSPIEDQSVQSLVLLPYTTAK